jgi:hypothetical protein
MEGFHNSHAFSIVFSNWWSPRGTTETVNVVEETFLQM